MFLATTADQRFWNKNEPTLFLGEWCKLYSERHVWNALVHEVLPYHWDDRKRLYRDYLYVNRLYEKILAQLSAILNKIHQESHSIRYWRIVIGPWLYGFIGMLYDRYISICSAEATGKVSSTITADYAYGYWTPRDFNEFNDRFADDAYNHYLYSRIIELSGKLSYETRDHRAIPGKPSAPARSVFPMVAMVKSLSNTYARAIPGPLKKIVFVSTFLRVKDDLLLQLSLGQCPFKIFPKVELPELEADIELREGVRVAHEDVFTMMLSEFLRDQIPQSYLESYQLVKQTVRKLLPSEPHIIFTANDHIHNECFKVWAATCTEQGALFIGTQHGGFEGMGRWFSLEEHQKKIWNKYYTWGWKSSNDTNLHPLPSGKLNSFTTVKPDRNGRILMVNTSFLRYAYFMQSMPVAASGRESYLQDLLQFLRCLSTASRNLLTVRLYPHDYEDYQKERFEQEFPNIDCSRGSKSIYKQLCESRLFIGNNNGTTILEALAANIPSVLFWNPSHWELREIAVPYFNEFRRVGILHDTPESAAEMVNKIYREPLSWWSTPAIQKAKDEFCHEFARTSKNWRKEWVAELRRLDQR